MLAALVERSGCSSPTKTTFELVHEALLEHWPRLAGWLEEDAQGRRLHGQLTQAASEWDARGRDAGRALPRRPPRGRARLGGRRGGAAALNRLEREFLEESRTAATPRPSANGARTGGFAACSPLALVLLLAALAAGAVALHEREARARRRPRRSRSGSARRRSWSRGSTGRSCSPGEGVDLDDSTRDPQQPARRAAAQPRRARRAPRRRPALLDDALSPDGRLLAARSNNGSVTLLRHADAATRRGRSSRAPGRSATAERSLGRCARSPSARTAEPSPSATAIRRATGRDLFLVNTRTHRIHAVVQVRSAVTAETSRSRRTAAPSSPVRPSPAPAVPPDELIVARNAADGRELRRSTGDPLRPGSIGFTPATRVLSLVTSGETRRSCSTRARSRRSGDSVVAGAGALSPSADIAAFGQDDGSVVLVDLRTGAPRTRCSDGRPAACSALAFSRDGTVLATTSDDGSVGIWDVPTGALRERFTGHAGAALGPVFSRDGVTLYTGSSDGSVIVWDVRGESRLGQPFRFDPVALAGAGAHTPAQNASTAVAVSPDNSIFATSPAPGHVTLWRASDQAVLAKLAGPFGYVVSLAFSHDGRLLAATGNAPNTVVWNVARRKIVRILRSPVSAGAAGVAFSPDDHLLATSGVGTPLEPGLLRVYDLRTNRLIGNVVTPHNTLQDLDFTPDGRLLTSAGLDGKILVWDVARRALERTILHHVAILTIRFSPDGKTIATGDLSGNVNFWDAQTGRPVGHTLGEQNGYVHSVAYLADGNELVTTSGDGQLRLWDIASGRLIGSPLPGATTGGWGTARSRTAAARSRVFSDGTGVIWNVDPATWKTTACRLAHRNLTHAEWHDLIPDRAYTQVC